MKDQKKQGILISYINIVLSTLVNIVLTPLLISALSDDGYSIYKIMRSFAGPLSMLNLGVATVVARSVAKFLAEDKGNQKEKENTYAIALFISVIMGAIIMAAGYVMQLTIPNIYGAQFTTEDLKLAQQMFIAFTATTAVHIITEPFRGALIGHGRFIFYYGSQTLQYIFRFLTIYLLITYGFGALAVVMVDLIISVIILLSYCFYTFIVLRQKIRFYKIDKRTLIEFTSFAAAILLQAIVNQVNNNLDIMILGASQPAEIITMYSSALTIYSVYNMLISVFSGVYLPQATKLVEQKATGEQLTDFIIKPGRIQALIAVFIVGGFAVTGMDFISIWIGERYINAYYVALFLMIPVTIPLVESVAIAILDAKLKRIFRSATLLGMAILNFVATIFLVQFCGFWGALIGTVISLLVGHGLLMNIYYKKALEINVIRMFREIFSGILLVGVISVVMCMPLSLILKGTIISFIIKAVAYTVIYIVFNFVFVFNKNDRDNICSYIIKNKFSKKVK